MNMRALTGRTVENWTEPLLGVEIEVERCSQPRRLIPYLAGPAGWNMESDGSLRNHGLELISQPRVYEDIAEGSPRLYEGLHTLGVEFSKRCGVHVHRNILHLTAEQLSAVICAYALVEPLFVDVCGSDREENIYCVPLYRTPGITQSLASTDYGQFGRTLAAMRAGGWCKYSSLNLFTVRALGTIEFRMAPAWDNVESLLSWVKLVDDFVARASRMEDAENVWRWATDDLFGFLEAVWPRFDATEFDNYEWRMNDVDSWAPALNLVRTKLSGSGVAWEFGNLESPITAAPATSRRRREVRYSPPPSPDRDLEFEVSFDEVDEEEFDYEEVFDDEEPPMDEHPRDMPSPSPTRYRTFAPEVHTAYHTPAALARDESNIERQNRIRRELADAERNLMNQIIAGRRGGQR